MDTLCNHIMHVRMSVQQMYEYATIVSMRKNFDPSLAGFMSVACVCVCVCVCVRERERERESE